MNANLTQSREESKPFSLFESTANLIRPETKSMKPIATVMESAMDRLHSMVKPSYFIEEAKISGEVVEVVFCLSGDESLPLKEIKWFEDEIPYEDLREYVERLGLNEFVNDYERGGENVQETFTLDFDTYMEEYEQRNHACAEWLRDNRGLEVAQ